MANKIRILWMGIVLLWSCSPVQKWHFQKINSLTNISPIGIVADREFLWLSDVGGNRIVKMDTTGIVLQELSNIKRPMHLALFQSKLYIPEYETDTIKIIDNQKIRFLDLEEQPDAPAAVAVVENNIAIADFYNHRIILKQKDQTIIIGKEGHQAGEFYYPTDIGWCKHQLYVADAYNNRIQVFDKQGKHLKNIGENDNIQVAAGLTVTKDQLFVADFEGNRILIYNTFGKLQQVLMEGLNKPVDVEVLQKIMWVVNSGDNSLVQYKLR